MRFLFCFSKKIECSQNTLFFGNKKVLRGKKWERRMVLRVKTTKKGFLPFISIYFSTFQNSTFKYFCFFVIYNTFPQKKQINQILATQKHTISQKNEKTLIKQQLFCNFAVLFYLSKKISAKKMSKHGRVLVAMSGGIDSTVTAMMLHEQGYEVVGITMKTWDYATSGGSKKETGCCSLDSINDARAVAVDMGFHHFIIDIRDEFGDWVIDNFVEEYLAGRTPNPCIMCNTHIKWAALLRRADALNCEFIATGHYAQKRFENGRYIVSEGLDRHKDQSYVLWGLKQENLARTMFPVGGFQKSEIRKMALDWGYEDLANKPESYEICFIPDNDYRGFLKRRVGGLEEEVSGGNFISTDGKILGQHDG